MRQRVRYTSGVSPVSDLNRSKNGERDMPTLRASESVDQSSSGDL